MKIIPIIHKNAEGAKWIDITDNLLLYKPKKHRRIIFRIYKHNDNKPWSIENFGCYIKIPFFFYEKGKGLWRFGTNSWYFWRYREKSKKRKLR